MSLNNNYSNILSSIYIFIQKLKELVKYYVSEANAVCGNKQNLSSHKTLEGLCSDKGINLCKYDKGNGVVVLDSSDYFNKLDKIILDATKFQEVKVVNGCEHPILQNENEINSILYRNIEVTREINS